MVRRSADYDPLDDDSIIDGSIPAGRGWMPADEDSEFMRSVRDVAEKLIQEKKKHQQTLAKAVKRSMEKHVARARHGNPAGGSIIVRREGLLARKNERDKKAAEALRANKNRATLSAHLVQDQGNYLYTGKQFVLSVLREVNAMDDDLPDELKPIGQVLSEYIAEILPGTFIETGTMLGVEGLKEIARATRVPEEEER